MATLTMPTNPGFASANFGLQPRTQVFTSPLSGTTQTLELPGALWFVTYTLPLMTRAVAAPWQAFLSELMGSSGRFHAFDPGRTTPRGIYNSGSDTPLCDAASQTGKSLTTDGWRNSGTGLLLPGDYFEVIADSRKELHMITAQVNSDGSGLATLNFIPPLQSSPANNAVITLTDPLLVMRLVDDGQTIWGHVIGDHVTDMAFSAIEVF